MISLKNISSSDLSLIGNKSKNLFFFNKAGFNIPEGVILFAEDIMDIDTIEIPNYHSYAIRSAAYGEDGRHSFAGIFKSLLNVSKEDVKKSILEVYDSFFTKKSLVYQKIKQTNIIPQILVQEMIESKYSFVLYITDSSTISLSITEGECSQIVSGTSLTYDIEFYIEDIEGGFDEINSNKDYKSIGFTDFLNKLFNYLKSNDKLIANGLIDIEATFDGTQWWLLQYREINI